MREAAQREGCDAATAAALRFRLHDDNRIDEAEAMTETPQPCVIFAGTSASVREALERVAALRGIRVVVLVSVNDCRRLLDRHGGALLVTELNGDAATALHSMAEVTQRHPQVLVLAVIEHGDIPTAVKAIRAGAANCLEKPVEIEPLTSAMDELLDQIDMRSGDSAAPLTRMETTVLQYILQGRPNRQIAASLHRSPRTIEVHRRHIMRKLGASTIVDLVKAASARGLG